MGEEHHEWTKLNFVQCIRGAGTEGNFVSGIPVKSITLFKTDCYGLEAGKAKVILVKVKEGKSPSRN